MDYSLTEEQALLKEYADRYLRDVYPFSERRAMARTPAGFSNEFWLGLAEMGWLGLLAPEQAGGLSQTIMDSCILHREMGRHLVIAPYTETAVIGATALSRCSDEPAELRRLVEGQCIVAFAWQELGLESAATPAATVCQRRHGAYVINGTKICVRFGAVADAYIVSASRPESGLTECFLVHRCTPGISIDSYATLDGANAATVRFDNVEVPEANKISGGSEGSSLLEELLFVGCLTAAAEATGIMADLVSATLDYLQTRKQFGRKLSEFQVLKHRLVDMFARSELAESLVFQSADLYERDRSPDERAKAIHAAFAFVARHGRSVGKAAVQLHGAIGTMDESKIGHALARLTAISQSFGGADYHLQRYACIASKPESTTRSWSL
jgi:alkylation response protein AidB-like acyl-CoA dehydrogenase